MYYFVSTYGNDNNSGSFDNPFKSLNKALSVLTTNDKLIIRGGQHDEALSMTTVNIGQYFNNIHGKSGARITKG